MSNKALHAGWFRLVASSPSRKTGRFSNKKERPQHAAITTEAVGGRVPGGNESTPRTPLSFGYAASRPRREDQPRPNKDATPLNVFWHEWLRRGRQRTFSPFHRGVVTTYALEIGPSEDGDNRDQSFSAFRAARYFIHEMIPPDISTPNP
jgi:hypothetical protein